MLSRGPNGQKQQIPRWLSLLLLSVLAALTVVAVVAAFLQSRSENVDAEALPTSSLPAPQPEPTAEPEPEPPAFVSPVMQRMLAVSPADSSHVLRATVGQCPDPAGSLEVSFDGGATWDAGVISSVEARQLLQLDATAEITRMTALVADCSPQVARSFVGGTSWEVDPEQPASWFIDPSTNTSVHTPSGVQTLPCEAVGLSGVEARGVVLCSDSTVLFTENSGEAWSSQVPVPNAVAVGLTPGGFTVASFGEDECTGVRTRVLAADELGSTGACIDAAGAENGNVAIAAGSDAWYLWAGDSFVRSVNRGTSWE